VELCLWNFLPNHITPVSSTWKTLKGWEKNPPAELGLELVEFLDRIKAEVGLKASAFFYSQNRQVPLKP